MLRLGVDSQPFSSVANNRLDATRGCDETPADRACSSTLTVATAATGIFFKIVTNRYFNCVARYGGSFFDQAVDKALFRKYFESHEYSAGDLRRLKKGSMWTLSAMWPPHLEWDAIAQARSVPVPVTFLHGCCDRITASELVLEYLDQLQAPRKKLIWFERSGHCPLFEEPGLFQQTLIDEFLPAAGRDSGIRTCASPT